jgi:L-aspartate oxidase
LDTDLDTDLDIAFDVLVIGAGAAGLYSALCLPSTLAVGLVTKDTLALSASDWAQGGIAAALAPDDSPDLHVVDTLKAGAGLCDRNAVELLVNQARPCIDDLVAMGVGFDRESAQAGAQLAMTLEAAHSRRRVLHAADTTGHTVVTTLAAKVLEQSHIRVFNQALALDLWLSDTGHCQGICLLHQGQLRWVRAKAVVLATGGGGQVYAQTTNPTASTGDGVGMAWRAGAKLRDLEFMQFHPTALAKKGAPRFLISEAVRGEGAHLVGYQGERFAFDYHPDGELAPRDIVSRAIFAYLQAHAAQQPHDLSSDLSGQGSDEVAVVGLDLRSIPVDKVHHRFPNIIRQCQTWGVDVFSEPIPVTPAAHYWMGGIVTDTVSKTTVPGLYAIGENASTGVHGANRLASNSLLECLVFGAQLRDIQLPTSPPPLPPQAAADSTAENGLATALLDPAQAQWLQDLRLALPQQVWQSAGISREATTLQSALIQVQQWQTDFAALPLSQAILLFQPGQTWHIQPTDTPLLRLWVETRNLLDCAALILKSALFRTESRGGHYRSDYPATSQPWQGHTLIEAQHCWLEPL